MQLAGGNDYTPTQRAILQTLSDGLRHSKSELRSCLPDDLADDTNLRWHVCMIRKMLRPRGEDIICEFYERTTHYRHVRLLSSPYDGKS
jgi:hypothetical protein